MVKPSLAHLLQVKLAAVQRANIERTDLSKGTVCFLCDGELTAKTHHLKQHDVTSGERWLRLRLLSLTLRAVITDGLTLNISNNNYYVKNVSKQVVCRKSSILSGCA